MQQTSWLQVWLAFLAGCVAAFQIGKIPAALPLLIAELQLDLFWAGTVVAVFSLLSACLGLLIGSLADRLGPRNAALVGLVIGALAGLWGAGSAGLWSLLASRVLEGLGFILAVVALPTLITVASAPRDRPLALGLWGAFLPAGMSVMMLLSPWLMALVDWRGLWVVIAVLMLGWSGLLWLVFRNQELTSGPRPSLPQTLRSARRAGPLLLFLCFTVYSAQFLAVTSFLPTLFIDTYALSVQRAATLGAFIVAANVLGNIAAGWLLRRGLPVPGLLVCAAVLMGICALGVFSAPWPLSVRVAAAFMFTCAGGLIPGSLFASVPDYVAHPGQAAGLIGLLLQGAGIGQLLGPLLLTATVNHLGGWVYAPVFTLCAAGVGVLCALALVKTARS